MSSGRNGSGGISAVLNRLVSSFVFFIQRSADLPIIDVVATAYNSAELIPNHVTQTTAEVNLVGFDAARRLYGLSVRIDGGRWVPPAAFTGLRETFRTHEHCHQHAVLLATFTPVGATAFLRPSLEEFAGSTTDLNGILDRSEELGWLCEQLAGAKNHERRISDWCSGVAIKMGRRARRDEGAYLNRYVTEEQRGRRPIFIATLWCTSAFPR